MDELQEAAWQLGIAQNHFANAEPAYIETAVHELCAAECRLRELYKEATHGKI